MMHITLQFQFSQIWWHCHICTWQHNSLNGKIQLYTLCKFTFQLSLLWWSAIYAKWALAEGRVDKLGLLEYAKLIYCQYVWQYWAKLPNLYLFADKVQRLLLRYSKMLNIAQWIDSRTPSIVRKKRWKQVILTKPNSAFYLYYDRTLLLFSRPMRYKGTSALREIFQYSSLAEKPFDQWEIATHWRAFQIQDIVTLI